MAYPPVIPPNNRTNATDMVDVHASDHNAISTALTAIVATAWVALPLGTNFQAMAGYVAPQYRMLGDVVQIRGQLQRKTSTIVHNDLLGTLPVGFRPLLPGVQFICNAGANALGIGVGTDGTIATQYPAITSLTTVALQIAFSVS